MENEKFFNYYVELLTSSLHDAIGKNLVFQTQAKIAKEDLDLKVQTIESLSSKLEEYSKLEETVEKTVQEKSAELNNKLQEINSLIQERDAAKNEASHIEIFRNELITAKQQIQNKDVEINRIKNENQTLILSVRQELEREIQNKDAEINRIKNENRNTISEIKNEQDIKLKELEEEIKYLKLTPSQKRKYDLVNKIGTEISEKEEKINKDGGNF